MGSGVPTGPRGGTHQDRGSNIPTPQHHRYRVTHADPYQRWRRFQDQLYSRQLRVTRILMKGGAVSHRARTKLSVSSLNLIISKSSFAPYLFSEPEDSSELDS